MQTIFIRGPSATIRMLLFVIASIALMTIDHRWHSLEMARNMLSSVVYPLQYTIDLPIKLYYWADEVLSTKQTLLDKNREFAARHLENRVQLQKLDIIEKENDRLRSLLSATPKTTERLLISEIINVDVDPYRQLILLNKGSSSDVYQGQPIIGAHGVMGQIIHVGNISSTAMLITDASHALPVQIDRTGLRSNAFGTGKIDKLTLRHMPHNADIKVGDLLITSGLGGTFPPNYPVATVTKVEQTAGEAFATIEAMPLAQLDKSREVLMVWRNKAEAAKTIIKEVSEEKDKLPNDKAKDNKKVENKTTDTESSEPTQDPDKEKQPVNSEGSSE
jgi:rod shape-determining protein MreC